MATLKFKPDELLKKMRVNKYTADMLIKSNQQDVAADTGKMAADWYKNWKKENGLPSDSNALPPVDSVPTWARPHLFPRAEARDGMKIAKSKKKRNAQRAYEDFVRDSQNMPLDESFKDLRRGIDREGLDIMKDVLGLDEA